MNMVSGGELQGFEPRRNVGDQRSSMSTSGPLPLPGLMPEMLFPLPPLPVRSAVPGSCFCIFEQVFRSTQKYPESEALHHQSLSPSIPLTHGFLFIHLFIHPTCLSTGMCLARSPDMT